MFKWLSSWFVKKDKELTLKEIELISGELLLLYDDLRNLKEIRDELSIQDMYVYKGNNYWIDVYNQRITDISLLTVYVYNKEIINDLQIYLKEPYFPIEKFIKFMDDNININWYEDIDDIEEREKKILIDYFTQMISLKDVFLNYVLNEYEYHHKKYQKNYDEIIFVKDKITKLNLKLSKLVKKI